MDLYIAFNYSQFKDILLIRIDKSAPKREIGNSDDSRRIPSLSLLLLNFGAIVTHWLLNATEREEIPANSKEPTMVFVPTIVG